MSTEEKNKDIKKKERDITPKIKNADSTEALIEWAIETSRTAFNQEKTEKDMARFLREEFNQQYGLAWNVIVGKNFGSDVTHETKKYINLQIANLSILIWKSSWIPLQMSVNI